MATRQAQAAPEVTTVIGAGIAVNGRVSGEEDLHVEGRIEGSVQLSETFYVASGGTVVAEVRARDVVVSGTLVGNVSAEDSVTLNPGGKIVGDVTAPRVILADGASFSGNVSMGGEPPPRRERPRATSARRPVKASTSKSAAKPNTQKPASRSRSSSSEKTGRVAPPRVAAIPTPKAPSDGEVTVVVRHAALAEGEKAGAEKVAKTAKKTKKAAPRARVPKPGKRRVGRRS